MSEFPSSIDREAASSLLLLSSGPFFFSSSSDRSGSEGKNFSVGESYGEGGLSLSFVSTGTRSCDSAISNNGSSRKSSEDGFMNFKIAKKRRTSVIWSSADLQPTHSKDPEFDDRSSDSREESCLSTGSSEISSTESRIKTITQEKPHRDSKKKESYRSSSVRRRAVKILELLKMGYVKRSGAGGKHEPFVYKVA
ncbi:unnamed protein product [Thlaspi arvense]|uniref:Uncharacterized protein n=1 Tax=Thlaspi arvense TaxID=13288 RepID=A0AAU9S6M0_THLAR|nr:unnamed protein product [Thlaspi arvense]